MLIRERDVHSEGKQKVISRHVNEKDILFPNDKHVAPEGP